MRSFRFVRPMAVVLGASLALSALAPSVQAAVLYQENFDDGTFAANSAANLGTVTGGKLDFDDTNGGAKSRFAVVDGFTSPVMTFSFDVVAPVTNPAPAANNDLMLRAAIGTASDMAGSADDILEAIVWRNGNRGSFTNNANGTESIFVVANNKASSLTFSSPIDGLDVTLNGFQFIVYSRRNDNNQFGIVRAITTFLVPTGGVTPGDSPITRFAIGNSSNAMLGVSSIDNVAVVDEVSFQTVVPEPSALALLGLGALATLRRRRA
ncbi:MAG: PEP-CTERM sorting domain-containing protein [Tepidisphaeraceae bacterium]